MKQAIIIAVEDYRDPQIPQVKFAANDAKKLSKVFATLGVAKDSQSVLINDQATKENIESSLSKTIDLLEADDTFYLFYAGLGFSKLTRSFITCHDTDSADWEGTSVSLDPIFRKLQESSCKHVALFLDCREGSLPSKSGVRSLDAGLNVSELAAFFAQSARILCFTACKSDEVSSSSRKLKHGIWSYHLVEALDGRAPIALQQGRLLASALQNHLAEWVPRTLRTTHSDGRAQTPGMYGGAPGDFEIADLQHVLEARAKAANPDGKLCEVAFVRKVTRNVDSLSGFKKRFHRVPAFVNSQAEDFVASLAQAELKADLDNVYDDLVKLFDYARADLATAGPEDGAGSIMTPTFRYTIGVSLDRADPSIAIVERRVDKITDAEVVKSAEFEGVFSRTFDAIEFMPPIKFMLEQVVDTIQALKNPTLKVKFDRDLTYCDITLAEVDATIHVGKSSVSIVHKTATTPLTLIESFKKVSAAFVKHNVPLIA